MTDVDVAIIGGGVSGLAVAEGLIRSGTTVRLFEARSRLGGRIASVEVAGGQADLGATWFWPGEHRVDRLARELGLALHDQWSTGDALVTTNGTVRRVHSFTMPLSHRFSGGAHGLVDGLARRLPVNTIEFDCPVTRIEPGADRTTIHFSAGSISARSAVVALPPSLAMSRGLIDPANLHPKVREAASAIPVWMGAIAKAVAVYPQPFWRADDLSGTVSAIGGPFHEIHDMSGPHGTPAMLFGFGQSEPHRLALTAEVFVKQLTSLFGPQAASPVDAIAIDWRRESFTMPTEWPPSMRYDLFGSPLLGQPTWNGRLHWTSTETAVNAPGHIEGALAAAERTIQALSCPL